MIRPLGRELAGVLPQRDLNGDLLELVEREEVFRLAWGAIRPIKNAFRSLNWKGAPHQDPRGVSHRLTWDEEIARGNAELIADLNTPEGRAAYLECWWPAHLDGACLVWTTKEAKDAPYPQWSQIRTASIVLRLSPTLAFQTIRWGYTTTTTTRGRALWDLGIRRELWHPTQTFYAWLVAQGATARLTPLADADPLRVWTYSPTHTEKKPLAFYCERADRPITGTALDWLKGTP